MVLLSYKNRIALNYIISTALLIMLVFIVIYQIIGFSLRNQLNNYIQEEVKEHLSQIEIDKNNTYLIRVDQWRELENNTVNVNSIFVQFLDINNELIDKSPNLKQTELQFYAGRSNEFIDTFLNKKPIRQLQVPFYDGKKIVGHLILAMSVNEYTIVLANLKSILFISFPLILVLLFFIARFFAGRSIKPVISIIETSSKITKDKLDYRMALPENKDELYDLSKNINALLDRMQEAVEREKQFTTDASHELRTPLAVIKGTLEVLIRKPRENHEYEDKISFCIAEVDRLNSLVDELLLLARFEHQKQHNKIENVYLNALILDNLSRFSEKIKLKDISVSTKLKEDYYVQSDYYLLSMILSNLLSNAFKYSKKNGTVQINIEVIQSKTVLTISDNGLGIPSHDLDRIFNSFYRAKASEHPNIKGSGLGLSIVKRLCDLLSIAIEISSEEGVGTTVVLNFTN